MRYRPRFLVAVFSGNMLGRWVYSTLFVWSAITLIYFTIFHVTSIVSSTKDGNSAGVEVA
jgi:hypothetical protein